MASFRQVFSVVFIILSIFQTFASSGVILERIRAGVLLTAGAKIEHQTGSRVTSVRHSRRRALMTARESKAQSAVTWGSNAILSQKRWKAIAASIDLFARACPLDESDRRVISVTWDLSSCRADAGTKWMCYSILSHKNH